MCRWVVVVTCVVGLGTIGCSSDKSQGANASTGSAGKTGIAAGRGAAGGAGAKADAGGNAGTAGVVATAGVTALAGSAGAQTIAGSGGRAGSGGAKAGTSGGAGGGGTAGATFDAGMSMPDAALIDAQAGDDDDAGVCTTPPALNLDGLPKCSTSLCPAQDSVCLQTSVLEHFSVSADSIALLSDCDVDTKCVPLELAEYGGRASLSACKSLLGAEGRCLSTCVPQVAKQASQLPQDTCLGTDLCAPCYDPRTGEATGACTQGCDKGPTQPPKTFPHCCSDRGFCVPPTLAGSLASNLLKDKCASGTLCAPSELTDPTFVPKTCASLDGAEGRCLSTCLGGEVAAQADRLPTAGCGQNEVCAPCFDPITGEQTPACTINGDKPAKPAYRFPACCDNGAGTKVGVCVAPALAGSQASMLQQDTCASGRLCAPIKKAADPNYKFPRCTGLGAGACVPSCILPAAEAGLLSRVSCATGEVCAPCSSFGVSSTGACD